MRSFAPAEWAHVRARGKRAFLIRYGIVGRGLPLGILIAIAIEASLGGSLPGAFVKPEFLGRLLLCIGVFSATGCLNANVSWNENERRARERA